MIELPAQVHVPGGGYVIFESIEYCVPDTAKISDAGYAAGRGLTMQAYAVGPGDARVKLDAKGNPILETLSGPVRFTKKQTR